MYKYSRIEGGWGGRIFTRLNITVHRLGAKLYNTKLKARHSILTVSVSNMYLWTSAINVDTFVPRKIEEAHQ